MTRSTFKLTASCALYAASAQAADAKADAAAPAASGDESTLTEIVVTATKRETNLQKTPISISVLAPDAIKDRHI
jgi:iron complex outermembrane recepter protein